MGSESADLLVNDVTFLPVRMTWKRSHHVWRLIALISYLEMLGTESDKLVVRDVVI